jgi:hypothetical protein
MKLTSRQTLLDTRVRAVSRDTFTMGLNTFRANLKPNILERTFLISADIIITLIQLLVVGSLFIATVTFVVKG